MEQETEQRIRERAYAIWMHEGRPDGRAKEHWERAEKELTAGAQTLSHSLEGGVNPDDLTR